jgi:outer membrane protein assembly factor BamB/tetratricopeptide (TPR) repeat protein
MGTQGLGPKVPKLRGNGRPVNNNGRPVYIEDASNSYLLCLNLKPDVKAREEWSVPGMKGDANPRGSARRAFEGAPVASGGRVYIVQSLFEGDRTASAVVCYTAEKGKELWRRPVCDTKTAPPLTLEDRRRRHHLLTLAGPNVVYCAHAGAIVALDAVSGKRAWAVRYPSRGPETEEGDPSPRDLAPPVYADGRVYVAPLDSNRLFCLDADTGKTLWEREGVEIVHLLGVARGRVVFTTPDGIRALAAADGGDEGGWLQPGDGSKVAGMGRGFLAGGWVYWPTANPKYPLYALNVEDGTQEQGTEAFPPERFHRVRRGNLVLANGCLAVAGTQRLFVYVPEKRYLGRRKKEASQARAPASAFYHLALAEAGAGRLADALGHFRLAEKDTRGEKYQHTPVRDLARLGRHDVLLEMAARKQAAGLWERAAELFLQAAQAEFPVAARLEALSRSARMWTAAGQPGRAVAAWQAVLGDPVLRRGRALGWKTLPDTAATFAARRIREEIRAHGAAVYTPFEKKAAQLAAAARGEREPEVLEQLADEYPNAAATGPALLRLARLYDRKGRAARAARAYRLFLSLSPAAPLRREALAVARAGLARAYERQHCYAAARAAWKRLAEQEGDRTYPALDGKRTVRDFVAVQLQKPEYRPAPAASLPTLRLPLLRVEPPPEDRVAETCEVSGRLLVPEGGSDASRDKVFLLVRGEERVGVPPSGGARRQPPEGGQPNPKQ